MASDCDALSRVPLWGVPLLPQTKRQKRLPTFKREAPFFLQTKPREATQRLKSRGASLYLLRVNKNGRSFADRSVRGRETSARALRPLAGTSHHADASEVLIGAAPMPSTHDTDARRPGWV